MPNKRRDLLDCIGERLRLGYLRADVHLHTDDVDFTHFRGTLVNRGETIESNAELILVRAGGNVLVRVWIDVGIGTQGNRGAHPASAGRARDPIDVIQLCFALDIKAVNALLERIRDFFGRFSDARESTLRRIATRRQHAIKFAAGNDIEARAFVGEHLQNRAIRVRFDCVTDQVIERRERGVEPRVVIQNCSRTVNIERSPELLSNARKIDTFAVQSAVAITKRMHAEM